MNKKIVSEASQEKAQQKLLNRLKTLADLAQTEPFELLYESIESRVIGILGERGAGKSTLLSIIYNKFIDNKLQFESGTSLSKLHLLEPFDCSLLPSEIAPGTAVLLHLRSCLQKCFDPKLLNSNAILTKLDELIILYTRLEDNYRDLCLELSTSPNDYGQHIITGIRERLELRGKLREWLIDALRSLQIGAFVVLLDDFDLVPVQQVQRWLFSLLDELHQSQLIFIVTADIYRLEHLTINEKNQLDDLTGRNLIHKLLPTQNRVEIPGWPAKSRREFTLPGQKKLLDLVKTKIGEIAGEKDSSDLSVASRLISQLIPQLPRGIINFYQSLSNETKSSEIKSGEPKTKSPKGQEEERDEEEQEDKQLFKNFLELLAICRGEPLFARRLKEYKLKEWVRILQFSNEKLLIEDWQDLVDAACKRGNRQKTYLSPLRNLIPIATLDDVKGTLYHSHHKNNSQSSDPSLVGVFNPYKSDALPQDPLRHELLHIRPLRDATLEDQPLWAELLIDQGLANSTRSRMVFLNTWKPMMDRVENATFKIQFTRSSLRWFFDYNSSTDLRATLYWVDSQFDESNGTDEESLQIGWYPLLESLRGERDPLLPELLARLLVNVRELSGDLPPTGTQEALALLPGEIWAMVLLVDGLDRCPWEDFSGPLGWGMVTYLGLATAFVRSAYVYALCKCRNFNEEEENSLSDEQKQLLNGIRNRDPAHLLQKQEEDVLKELTNLFQKGDLKEKLDSKRDSLSQATCAFLSSPVYKAVVNLVELQSELLNGYSSISSAD